MNKSTPVLFHHVPSDYSHKNHRLLKFLLVISVLIFIPSHAVFTATVDGVVNVGEKRVKEGQTAQMQVDKLADQSRDLLAEYLTLSKTVDGLVLYNDLLGKQVETQQAEMLQLRESIDNVAVIERQIIPLAVRMLDGLEQFVALDVPFLPEERKERIEKLKAMMSRPDVSVAEKVRKVFEAYQVENEYGRTIESYLGQLDVDSVKREVEFLRIGRIALMYRTIDGEMMGHWSNDQWQALDATKFKRHLGKGLKIAAKQQAPDLITVPVATATEIGQ